MGGSGVAGWSAATAAPSLRSRKVTRLMLTDEELLDSDRDRLARWSQARQEQALADHHDLYIKDAPSPGATRSRIAWGAGSA